MKFLNSLTQEENDQINQECMESIFEDWCGAQADEGDLYLEERLMDFASPELKQRYEEFYND